MIEEETFKVLDKLLKEQPALSGCSESIKGAFLVMRDSFRQGGKLLICGNGGSAADCEHITGELMKGFLLNRPIPLAVKEILCQMGDDGIQLAKHLQGALPCIPLVGNNALITAIANDVDSKLIYAQQVYGYGKVPDVLLCISTSGNAKNVIAAAVTAKAIGMKTIGLTGQLGGNLSKICDLTINVPSTETYKIQEYHLPVYHTLCAMLEVSFFR